MQSFMATADHIIETTSGNHKMPSMHYHASYELYYLEMGSREYFVEDKLFSVAAGNFVLIAPGKLHRTGGAYCVRTLINFSREFLCRFFTPETVEQLLECFAHLKIVPSERQQGSCKQLLKRMAACSDDGEFALNLGLLLKELSHCGSEEIENDYVSTIVEYINRNFAEITAIGLLYPYGNGPRTAPCAAFAGATAAISAAVSIATVAVLGDFSGMVAYPFYAAVSAVRLGVIQRPDIVVVAVWMGTFFIRFTLFCLLFIERARHLFGKRAAVPSGVVLIAVLTAIALWIQNGAAVGWSWATSVYWWTLGGSCVGLPLLLWWGGKRHEKA